MEHFRADGSGELAEKYAEVTKRMRVLDVFLKWLFWGMFLGSLVAAVSACGLLGEKAPAQYAEELIEDESEMQWCSESSEGIGLNTVKVYIFAYYDHDITGELQGMKFGDHESVVELCFVPEGMSREQKWMCAEDAPFAFQEDIKDTQKMNTTVYINEQGTILYLEAIGD